MMGVVLFSHHPQKDIKKLRKTAIKSDKIPDSSNFEPKPPGFWKNNVKERYN